MIENNLIRRGRVVEVDAINYTCKVEFPDQEITTGDLSIGAKGGSRVREYNLPQIGDNVTVLLIPPSLSDGIVIDGVYGEDSPPPESKATIWSKTFIDGSKISYDMENHQLAISAINATVNINAKTINLNGAVIINGKPWLEHQHAAGQLKDGDSKPVNGKTDNGSV